MTRPILQALDTGRPLLERQVPLRYHMVMAINLRIPEDLDARLDALAEAEHTSKSALLLQGAELVIERSRRRHAVDSSLEFARTHDAELLKRLEEA